VKRFTLAFLCAAGMIAFAAHAQVKPEDAIKFRQSAMKLIGYNFGSIGNMVNDKKPYNKDEAIRNAGNVEALTSMPWEFFVPGTDKGETKAKADVWKDNEKFKAAAEKVQQESAKLAQVAKTGDQAALKTQFGATAQACKNCHDNFREK